MLCTWTCHYLRYTSCNYLFFPLAAWPLVSAPWEYISLCSWKQQKVPEALILPTTKECWTQTDRKRNIIKTPPQPHKYCSLSQLWNDNFMALLSNLKSRLPNRSRLSSLVNLNKITILNTNITTTCASSHWYYLTQKDQRELANYHHELLGSPDKWSLLHALCCRHLTTPRIDNRAHIFLCSDRWYCAWKMLLLDPGRPHCPGCGA